MKTGDFFTHENMLDCCVKIKDVTHLDNGLFLFINWFKKDGFNMGFLEFIFIKYNDLNRWRKFNVPGWRN